MVEVSIINWRRPVNVARILRAFKHQSVPCKIALCDVHDGDDCALDSESLALADTRSNFGGFNRYVPALGYKEEYTYFHDDDMLPGTRCIECFLDHARGDFGVLCQDGRIMSAEGLSSMESRQSCKEVFAGFSAIHRKCKAAHYEILMHALYRNHLPSL